MADLFLVTICFFSCILSYEALNGYNAVMESPSCEKSFSSRSGRIIYPIDGEEGCIYTIHRSEPMACLVQLEITSFDIVPSDGCTLNFLLLPDNRKICGVLGATQMYFPFPRGKDTLKLSLVSNYEFGNKVDVQITQLPGPCDQEQPQNTTENLGFCDQRIEDSNGVFTSPNFPASFSPNLKCRYQILRHDLSVCQLELDFEAFDLGKHNPPGCGHGAFLELPRKKRLCHPFTGKMMVKVSMFQDPVTFIFQSDPYSSGRGFKIKVTQIPKTCLEQEVLPTPSPLPPPLPTLVKRCYQQVSSYFGYFQPNLYGRRTPPWCEFVVYKHDSSICLLILQILASRKTVPSCYNNFIEIPNGQRMCIAATERRAVAFPEDAFYLTLNYYNGDMPEFNLLVEQVPNSCGRQRYFGSKWTWKMSPR